jgi:hypothetical protein
MSNRVRGVQGKSKIDSTPFALGKQSTNSSNLLHLVQGLGQHLMTQESPEQRRTEAKVIEKQTKFAQTIT